MADSSAADYIDGLRRKLCPICGDFVSGVHYGIETCECCKTFFRRYIQNKVTAKCDRQCVITLETRKQCKACRFAKCIEKGMQKENVRECRARGRYNRRNPGPQPAENQTIAK